MVDERIVNVNICKSKLQKRICRTVGPALANAIYTEIKRKYQKKIPSDKINITNNTLVFLRKL